MITNLKVGDAVVSTLQEDGSPSFAEVVSIYPPKSKLEAGDPLVRQQLINQSAFYDKYAEMFDRESAHEQLAALDEQFQQEKEAEIAQKEAEKQAEKQAELERKEAEKQEALAQKEAEKQAKLEEKEREREQKELERQARQAATKRGDSAMDRFTKNVMSSVGREVGRVITRGVMGLFKK